MCPNDGWNWHQRRRRRRRDPNRYRSPIGTKSLHDLSPNYTKLCLREIKTRFCVAFEFFGRRKIFPQKLKQKASIRIASETENGCDWAAVARDQRNRKQLCRSARVSAFISLFGRDVPSSFDRVSRALTQFKTVKSTQRRHGMESTEKCLNEKCVFYLQITIFQ